MRSHSHATRRIAAAVLLASAATCMSGCTKELASLQDNYVPASVEENYPIKVVQRPVQLTVQATSVGLNHADVAQVARFGKAAASARSATPVVVTYSSHSKTARRAAEQAAGLIASEGVSRASVVVTPGGGQGNSVTLTFATKIAETRPCGDWSENLRANQMNDNGPNFGCAFTQNFAAMVSNPEDFERPAKMTPATSAAQAPGLAAYESGEWTTPSEDAMAADTSSSSSSN